MDSDPRADEEHERRRAARMAGVSEVTLAAVNGPGAEVRAAIHDLSDTGLLVTFLEEGSAAVLAAAGALRFSFVLPTGPVEGTAEAVRVGGSEDAAGPAIALRFVRIESGTTHLTSFIHSAFLGVD